MGPTSLMRGASAAPMPATSSRAPGRRPAGRPVEPVRAGHQRRDRPHARHHRAAAAARACRRGDRMNRRELIAMVGSAAAWPLAARAQQPAMPVIGFFRSTSRDDSTRLVEAFRQGLKLGGFVEDQNVVIEYRWADNQLERQPALAADLVSRKVGVIVANQGASAAVMAANTTIPFVFVVGADPVKLGLVSSLSRPE